MARLADMMHATGTSAHLLVENRVKDRLLGKAIDVVGGLRGRHLHRGRSNAAMMHVLAIHLLKEVLLVRGHLDGVG